MKALKFSVLVLAGCLAFGGGMRSARADQGVAIAQTALAAKQRASLLTEIAKARSAHPVAFQKVGVIAQSIVKLDKEKRGPYATIAGPLKALGSEALMPMLEMLAVKGPARGTMTATAWTGLRVSLVDVVGMNRDPVAIPVLDAILDKSQDHVIVRSAALALGRIGDDTSAQKLATLATTAGPKQLDVLSGIGECRRPVAVHALADFSRQPADFSTTRLTLRALGGMGNSWAWKTPVLAKTGDGDEVRSTAAEALVAAFARVTDPALRLEAQKSILVVDDPSTPDLILQAKSGASAETRAALDRLADKFAHNPLHKYE